MPGRLPADLADALDRGHGRFGALLSSTLYFSSVGSTNDVAGRLAAEGREGAVVIADRQLAGRGRLGRVWVSPPAAGLYLSVVLAPGRARVEPQRALRLLTIAAGVALAEAVDAVTALPVAIKWPNDLLVGGRKVCGILAEAGPGAATGCVVLGYGINVAPTVYPPEIAARATSLEQELGRPVDRAAVCAESLAALSRRYEDLLAGRFDVILDAWRRRAPGCRGSRVVWDTPAGERHGISAGIDEAGALLVRVADRVERIVGGEVRWLAP